MKKFTIFYLSEDNRLKSWTHESNTATFMNVIKHFTSTMNVSSDCINSIHTEQVETEVLYFNEVLGLFDNYVRFEAGNDQNEDFTIEIALEEFELHLDCDTSKMYLLSEEDFLDAFDWCDSAKAIYDTWIKYGREGFNVTISK